MEKKDYPLALFALIALVVAGLACDLGKIGGEDQKASPLPQASQPTPTITQPKVSQVTTPMPWPTSTPTSQPSPTPVPTFTPSATLTPTSKPPTPTATPTNTATVPPPPPPPPLADIQFWVDDDNIPAGWCTMVHWQVVHVKAYLVDGQPRVGENGSFQTCPCWEERHTLHVVKADNSEQDFELTIHVYGECAAPPPPPEPPEPEEPKPTPNLKDKLYYFSGGEGWRCAEACEPEDISTLLAIRGHDECEYMGAEGVLCLYGFTPGEVVNLELLSPAGGDPFSSTVVYGDSNCPFPDGVEDDGFCISRIWLPIGIPTGQWDVHAVITDDGQIQILDLFTVDPHNVGEPSINTMPFTHRNPNLINPFESHWCDNYLPGDPVIVHGANFEPGQRLPLGIYYETGQYENDLPRLDHRETRVVRIDGNGDFTTVLQALSTPGTYWVVAVTDLLDSEVINPEYDNWVDCYRTEGATGAAFGHLRGRPTRSRFDRALARFGRWPNLDLCDS